MKTKKILSVLLSAVMLLSVLSVSVFAETPSYTQTVTIEVPAGATLLGGLIDFKLDLSKAVISALDGESNDYTTTFDSIVCDGVDYVADPDAFADLFTGEDAKSIDVTFTITFESEKVFGNLDYSVVVTGFMVPSSISTGIEIIDGLLPADTGLSTPQDIEVEGSVAEFPSIASWVFASAPTKHYYFDNETFDPSGLEVDAVLSNGSSGILTYNESSADLFTFVPSINENLNVNNTEVVAFFLGEEVSKTPVYVDHSFTNVPVSISKDKYNGTLTDGHGYHAYVCKGCGETVGAEPHSFDESAWVSNNDASFLKDGTLSNTCLVCGETVSCIDHGSATYIETFADYHFFSVFFNYIYLIVSLITGSVR